MAISREPRAEAGHRLGLSAGSARRDLFSPASGRLSAASAAHRARFGDAPATYDLAPEHQDRAAALLEAALREEWPMCSEDLRDALALDPVPPGADP
jgi:hypothetical protein